MPSTRLRRSLLAALAGLAVLTTTSPAQAPLTVPQGWSVLAIGSALVAVGKPTPMQNGGGVYDTEVPLLAWLMPPLYPVPGGPPAVLRTTLKTSCATNADRGTWVSRFESLRTGAVLPPADLPSDDVTLLNLLMETRSLREYTCAGHAGTPPLGPLPMLPAAALGASRQFDSVVTWIARRLQSDEPIVPTRLDRTKRERMVACDMIRNVLAEEAAQNGMMLTDEQIGRLQSLPLHFRHIGAAIMLEGRAASQVMEAADAAVRNYTSTELNRLLLINDDRNLVETEQGRELVTRRCLPLMGDISRGL